MGYIKATEMRGVSTISHIMAHTARTASERKEYFDSPEVLEQKVDQLAAWVRDSKHCIAFTVSTRYVHDEYSYCTIPPSHTCIPYRSSFISLAWMHAGCGG